MKSKRIRFWKSFLTMMLTLSLSLPVTAFAAGTTELNEATKQEWYQEYQEIIKEVSAESEFGLTLSPYEDFEEGDWKTPEEFRDFAEAMANAHVEFASELAPGPQSSGSATKRAYITVQNVRYGIDITGRFTTQYDSNQGRQLFSGTPSFTSKAAGNGSWSQIGTEWSFIDSGRTCSATISGNFTIAGVGGIYLARTEFYCSAQGNIT